MVYLGASLVAQTVKDLPAMQETWVRSLGQEDPLEKGMAKLLRPEPAYLLPPRPYGTMVPRAEV